MKKTSSIYFFGIVIAVIFILIYTFTDTEVKENYAEKLEKFRVDKNEYLKHSEESPIPNKENFEQLNYFSPNEAFRIKANIEPIQDTTKLKVRMTGGEVESYIKYGYASFKMKDQMHKLLLLKSTNEDEDEKLFLPFGDKTNGFDTYGGGRYLDIELDKNGQLMIDFNFAYNPFCAYNDKYTCPIPPAENFLDIAIEAGEKTFAKEEKEK